MQADTNTLLIIIGELEVMRRLQAAEIENLNQQLAELQKQPTPIKSEAVVGDE